MAAEEVVQRLFAAFVRRDADELIALVDETCRFWPQGTAEAVGRADPYIGHAGMLAYFEDVSRAWEHLELQPTDVRGAGDGIVCFGVAIGTLKGQAEEQRIPVIWVFRLREGKIVFGRAVASAAEAAELVGS